MYPFKRNARPLCCLHGVVLAAAVIVAGCAPGLAQAQACGGNSTVDILGAQTATGARVFLAQLKTAVRANDKEKIESMIAYPLLLIQRSGARTHIRRKEAFLQGYQRLLTPSIRDAILHQTARCLFGNSSGAMVGDGQVWFREQAAGDWKITTVNQSIAGHN